MQVKKYILGKAIKITDDGCLLVEAKDGSKFKLVTKFAEECLEKNKGRALAFGYVIYKKGGAKYLTQVTTRMRVTKVANEKTRRVKAYAEMNNRQVEQISKGSGLGATGKRKASSSAPTRKGQVSKLTMLDMTAPDEAAKIREERAINRGNSYTGHELKKIKVNFD